ncbi:hypothetical protein N7481_007100 [Penicillium waksmanii]|uniref:uncharacterized protein n=1 Tax=Penicillium waksmanii TaxID=69791 RepID=UPI0025467167|nr:uncharacterized protein N7481_007100 [Penicillium waksmanii]KAJ5979802.1 hypothetical protein N7481_007100 [Penicillium waksmanii]
MHSSIAQPTENVDPSNPPKTDYDRRREQVRRAQKKHREQRDHRLRSLEDELHRLYSLTSLADELNELEFENGVLREIALRCSIPLPQNFQLRSAPLAEVTIFGNHGHHQHLSVTIPNSATHMVQDAHRHHHNSELSDEQINNPSESGSAKYLNLTQMGIDFVLSLERPCLFHTRAPDSDEPSGHAMSMQGMILVGAPMELEDKTSWEVPAQQLDKLFELSGHLGLDGYVTPVQAWNRLMKYFDLASIDLETLEMLRSAMIPHIKCYGFGAIMEEEVFEEWNGLFNFCQE